MATIITSGLPQWQSHKRVRADKIQRISYDDPTGVVTLYFDGDAKVHVSHQWQIKHHPQVGGYFVMYDDGYSSYSPPGPFESGYTRIGQ